MKHDKLRAIAHNICDSLASGIGFPIGIYTTDIFKEAQNSEAQIVTVDLLNGVILEGNASESLIEAVKLYRGALEKLCKKHDTDISSFKKLESTYSSDTIDRYVTIITEDTRGKSSTDKYIGVPLKRIRDIDHLGRIRTKR